MVVYGSPVDLCLDPYDPANIPWMCWQLSSPNLRSRDPNTQTVIYKNDSNCKGVFVVPGACGGIESHWKLVPLKSTNSNTYPSFQLHNRLVGGPVSNLFYVYSFGVSWAQLTDNPDA